MKLSGTWDEATRDRKFSCKAEVTITRIWMPKIEVLLSFFCNKQIFKNTMLIIFIISEFCFILCDIQWKLKIYNLQVDHCQRKRTLRHLKNQFHLFCHSFVTQCKENNTKMSPNCYPDVIKLTKTYLSRL